MVDAPVGISLAGVKSSAGGVEVYLECPVDGVQELVLLGRKRAAEEAQKAGYQVNAISSEVGPFPIDKTTGNLLMTTDKKDISGEEVKRAQDAGNLLYRKKFVFTFIGG